MTLQIKDLIKKKKAFIVVWEIPIILWIKELTIAHFINVFHIFIAIRGSYKPMLHVTPHTWVHYHSPMQICSFADKYLLKSDFILPESHFLLNHFLLLFFYSCPSFFPFAVLHLSHPMLLQLIPTQLFMSVSDSYMILSSLFPFFPPLSPSSTHSGHFQTVPCFHDCGSTLFISLFLCISFLL